MGILDKLQAVAVESRWKPFGSGTGSELGLEEGRRVYQGVCPGRWSVSVLFPFLARPS